MVDGEPECTTLKAIRCTGIVRLSSAKGRATQMNCGAAEAGGEILLFVHADSRLPEDAFSRIEAVMSDGRYAAGAFDLGVDSAHPFIRFLCYTSSLRARLTRIPYGDQAIFIRRDYFRQIGGYPPIPLMEDVELMKRIKGRGDKIYIIKARVVSSARRWHREGILTGWLRNHKLRILYFLGVPAAKLVKAYPDVRAKKCIILFARCPRQGKVKTRLARQLGARAALELYRNFILDMADTLAAAAYDSAIFVTPGRDTAAMARWLGRRFAYYPQRGKDLGERMKNAFNAAFERGYESCILIGSDLPDLPASILDKAFQALTDHDAVMGPARDGGYYLVGFRRETMVPAIFEHIPWGTDTVFTETMAVFRQQPTDVSILPERRDMDEAADLFTLLCQKHPPARTGRYFRQKREKG